MGFWEEISIFPRCLLGLKERHYLAKRMSGILQRTQVSRVFSSIKKWYGNCIDMPNRAADHDFNHDYEEAKKIQYIPMGAKVRASIDGVAT